MYVLGFIVFITTKKLVFGNNYIYIRNKKFLRSVIIVAIFLLPILYSGCRIFNRTATGGGIIFFLSLCNDLSCCEYYFAEKYSCCEYNAIIAKN